MPVHSETVSAADRCSMPLFALANALVPDGETLASITITAHTSIDAPPEQLYRIMWAPPSGASPRQSTRAGCTGAHTLKEAVALTEAVTRGFDRPGAYFVEASTPVALPRTRESKYRVISNGGRVQSVDTWPLSVAATQCAKYPGAYIEVVR